MLIIHTNSTHQLPITLYRSSHHDSRASILIEPEHTVFDPMNASHCTAYLELLKGNQTPGLRFKLEHPYLDVVTMMSRKMADCWADVVMR